MGRYLAPLQPPRPAFEELRTDNSEHPQFSKLDIDSKANRNKTNELHKT